MGIRRTLIEFKPALNAFYACAYPLFRIRLLLATFRDRRASRDPTLRPVPPARLRWRIQANEDLNAYLEAGKVIAQSIQDLCAIAGRDFDSFTDILDFGSGCGRVIQNFRGRSTSCTLYATDIDPELASWGKGNLPDIRWSVNGHRPPLPFGANAFDLIYGISVFSHLDEDFQHAWLRELQRVARPGAILILTVQGENTMKWLRKDSSYSDTVNERGFIFVTLSKGRFKLDGFPDFYQAAFHTKEYVYKEWSAYFDIVDYIERGIDPQDAVVLRKPMNPV
ncbi:class I SAM-dependent methyltransferase [Mycobacterium sp. E787]|uniref:class I SAM-dependent methyltransferase n=1 Tax=Mycobacterium sp. E787 TaxID=1834150 RepID=UPI0009EE8115|nr:class I SAM-dependent methyltransferase [Mycobacterium sp. E787]